LAVATSAVMTGGGDASRQAAMAAKANNTKVKSEK
jgi:hypothetical protein